ncbi:MAG: flagellar basal body rod protein FlgC [Spirochaetes bacterium]|nr:flagellar basal body rod protein FlgC [Spirochaetota bacterium]
MGMFTAINTSSSGLSAQRLRMDVIANNIANASTTRTAGGGPYRRKRAILMPTDSQVKYRLKFLPRKFRPVVGRGVRVLRVEEDQAPFRMVYDPTHPDAIKSGPKSGYVMMPNINIVTEMVDMISASRSYDANVAMIDHSKSLFNSALEIGR